MASNHGKWVVLHSIYKHTGVVTISISGNHIFDYGLNSSDTDYCPFHENCAILRSNYRKTKPSAEYFSSKAFFTKNIIHRNI